MLLFLSHLSLAIARERTTVLQSQEPTIPPHTSATDFRSLRAWQGDKAKSITTKYDDLGVVSQTVAHHNNFGFRITGKKKSSMPSERHLFLNGCSWTYGAGVDGTRTFAAHLEEKLESFRVVNMGARGGSPNEALYIWRNFSWEQVYPEKQGHLIYTLISDHFERVTRTWRYLHWAPPFTPVYDENLAHFAPSFEFLDYKVAKFMRSMDIDKWWLRLTSHFNKGDPEKFNSVIVRYLRGIKAAYLKRFPQGRFVVTWMNITSPSLSPNETASFLKALEAAGIEYWLPPPELKQPRNNYTIPRDGHPSELAHEEYAQFLLQNLKGTR